MMADPAPRGDAPPDALVEQARAWARRLGTGRPTTRDASALRRWCALSPAHRQAWSVASAEWRAVGNAMRGAAAEFPEFDAALGRARRQLARERSGRRAFLAAGGAAVAGLGVAAVVRPPWDLWPGLGEMGADYRTAKGEQRDIDLDRHVRLALNTLTAVDVGRAGQGHRVRLIAGEAAVVSDGAVPLQVQAGAGTVELATAAGIEVRRLAGGRVCVACTGGRAELRHPSGSLRLAERQEVFYDNTALEAPRTRAAEAESPWRQGIVAFNETPLVQAVEEINRYRPGRVVLMNERLAHQRISGRFAIGSLDQALAMIETLYQARMHRWGDVVVLS